MPCYDKKLEASRQDFFNDIYSTRDVDCVITTGELELLMREKGWDLSLPVSGELDSSPDSPIPLPIPPSANGNGVSTLPPIPELITHAGTSSGSYLHSIIAHVQETSDVPLSLSVKMVRNADYEEFVLRKQVRVVGKVNGVMNNGVDGAPDRSVTGDAQELGEVVFKGAKCYGFRNLQNVVRKVGRERGVRTASGAAGRLGNRGGRGGRAVGPLRRLKKGTAVDGKEREEDRGYDYVEVMACPGGCVNGGGQLKPVLPTPAVTADDTAMVVDEEGYKRDWAGSGVAVESPASNSMEVSVLQNARWGDKEWTRQVEEVYWRDTVVQEHSEADAVVRQVWDDLYVSTDGVDPAKDRQRSRQDLFRTQYRAVENEVIGLAVVW
jgi:iron only hydrogenase large subunit-like protein